MSTHEDNNPTPVPNPMAEMDISDKPLEEAVIEQEVAKDLQDLRDLDDVAALSDNDEAAFNAIAAPLELGSQPGTTTGDIADANVLQADDQAAFQAITTPQEPVAGIQKLDIIPDMSPPRQPTEQASQTPTGPRHAEGAGKISVQSLIEAHGTNNAAAVPETTEAPATETETEPATEVVTVDPVTGHIELPTTEAIATVAEPAAEPEHGSEAHVTQVLEIVEQARDGEGDAQAKANIVMKQVENPMAKAAASEAEAADNQATSPITPAKEKMAGTLQVGEGDPEIAKLVSGMFDKDGIPLKKDEAGQINNVFDPPRIDMEPAADGTLKPVGAIEAMPATENMPLPTIEMSEKEIDHAVKLVPESRLMNVAEKLQAGADALKAEQTTPIEMPKPTIKDPVQFLSAKEVTQLKAKAEQVEQTAQAEQPIARAGFMPVKPANPIMRAVNSLRDAVRGLRQPKPAK